MNQKAQVSRSATMAKVRNKDTTAEITVRKALHKRGVRFRLHRRDLPGTPDIVLPRYKLAIFVHGCFWHQHKGCRRATVPQTNTDFWQQKFMRNLSRDAKAEQELVTAGWKVVVIWECELRSSTTLDTILDSLFGP